MEMLQKIRKTADVNKLVILQDESFQILICNIQSSQEMSVKYDISQSQDICLVDQTLSKKRLTRSDRFVQPNVRTSQASTVKKTRKSSSDSSYQHYLSDTMLQNDDSSSIRKFTVQKTQNKKMKNRFSHKMNVIRNEQEIEAFRKFRVLGWKDNYYTNLLDWSHNNFICAGYLNDLCLYNMAINQDFQSSLYRKFSIGLNGEYLTALKSSSYQTKIALGYSNGSFKIYDYFKQKSVYNGYHHIQRIGTIQWSSQLILTGSKDQFIRAFDPRTKKPYQLPTQIQKAHTQEVCGVKQRGRFVSSGGNDNKVNIYDIRKSTIFDTYAHTAAVKAMAWIGDKSLVTGGGTADKKIKYWSQTQKVYQEVDTGSQVCSLCWSPGTSELVSCQGFSLNQIIIWNKNGERQLTFHGHTTRVLYSALSPNGEYLATGAGDQCLKIWKLFPGDQKEPTLLKEEIR